MTTTSRLLQAGYKISATLLFATLSLATPAESQLPAQFNARANVSLCADYKLGGVTLYASYRVSGITSWADTPITNITTNPEKTEATIDFKLPSTFTTNDIEVVTYCSSTAGYSSFSNGLTITNCDSLALRDTDFDGITNNLEDTNCDNFFSPGDYSNPDNIDSDGDGARDLVEKVSNTSPTNAGSSPRPMIVSSAAFDPDGDGDSNPVVWRPGGGNWFIRDYNSPGNHVVWQWGLFGDTPFTYQPAEAKSDVGVVRRNGNSYDWYFHGPGFQLADNSRISLLQFGLFGDVLIPGPWEVAGVTSPAFARLWQNVWTFYIYQRDGSVRIQPWGKGGDLPKPQDYDGDGLFDIAVYRPTESKSYVINSSDDGVFEYEFGSGTADFSVRGDFDGDGVDDISYWEPLVAMFYSMTSANGFNDALARVGDSNHYDAMQLGLYYVHVPLSWNRANGKYLYTVVDHQTGNRYIRDNNSAANPPLATQWGLPGDAHG